MVQDGTQDDMLRLLQRKAQAGRWLDVRGAPQVFDVVPRDLTESLEVHDLV